MRYLLAATLFFLIACNNADKKEGVKVAGAWKMLSQNLKSEKTDTSFNSIQQLKILTDDQMMYANVNPADSASSFGVGHYTVDADTLSEHVIYTSDNMSKNDTPQTFKLVITITDKGYKQVIPDLPSDGQHYTLTEEYEKAGAETKTSLDGVWKLTRHSVIKGNDTTVQTQTQYKAYYGGNVIWGHTFTDSLNKIHTGIGFGKFEMSGDDKVKENMVSSTYAQVRGQTFDLAISMNGTDEFTQTITDKDGTKEIETYQRLKK